MLHVERHNDLAFCIYPLSNLKGQASRDIRFRVRDAEIVGIGLAALTQHQNIGKTLSGEKCRLSRLSLHNSICRGCGAIDEEVCFAQQCHDVGLIKLLSHNGKPLLHALENPLPGGQSLADSQVSCFVSHHHVSERAADVDGNPVPHVCPLSVGDYSAVEAHLSKGGQVCMKEKRMAKEGHSWI